MNHLSLTIVGFLTFAACLAAGLWLGMRGRRTATLACAGLLAVILFSALLRWTPEIEFSLADSDIYVAIRPFWKYPFALALLGIGVTQATAVWRRIAVEVVAGCVLLFAGRNLYDAARTDPPRLYGVPNADGICQQTSRYSCGAAAASTLLARLGVPSDEREMAVRCGTSPWMGTDEFYACRGLRRKLAGTGLRPRLVAADWDDLRRLSLPAMAVMKFSFLIDHWVVILRADEDGVELADPLRGRVEISKDRFLDNWRCVLLAVECRPRESP